MKKSTRSLDTKDGDYVVQVVYIRGNKTSLVKS
jgi:hypothetical protein